ncbi:diguanylate cyclase (GGDEF) domain-containing protein [Maridesulfovibrio ferrireducens]|uniref:diguanylate cyclase n=1 Tax=Maridesulfovibrio ferrireducens TaxID=246191 RepID=A0A1G9CEV4_9BACT|nr:GGDEF domain-containing protein [Maridesulfovibrio ferrireducens]SDK50243.1 diguanylate cyclase (GGDEF) domain-containing protein [Maridesulfovibrio ferrireducens]
MNRGERPELLWGFGLNSIEADKIEDSLGPGFFLRNFSERALPGEKEFLQPEKPSATWIPLRVWNELSEARRATYRKLESTQRILIQDESQKKVDLESVLEDGFLAVVSSPLTSSKVQDALFRAKEVSGLYGDLYRMTEEIIMERELLSRKTEQLMFLNTVLSNATERLEVSDILGQAAEDLKLLLPVLSVQGVFWEVVPAGKQTEAEIFVNPGLIPAVQAEWTEFMIGSVTQLSGIEVGGYNISETTPVADLAMCYGPTGGRVLALPLISRGEKFGCLVMLCDKSVRLAKDQVNTLNAAVNHLSLALSNALMFTKIKTRADRDGLTRVYNRRSFDERLVEELRRHQRHNMDLSLLMVDLDHFKSVNDTYGHMAGDLVLETIARIFEETFRTTDFIARYGGEEFVILLPHTKTDQAKMLAERIREKIESKNMSYRDVNFNVTVSVGVSSVRPGSLAKETEIVRKADDALYIAKEQGRNRVVVSAASAARLKVISA